MAAASPALAQVTVDLHALQALPERPAYTPAPRSAPRPAPPVASRAPAPAASATPAPSGTAPTEGAAAPSATAAALSATAAEPTPRATAAAPAASPPAVPETAPSTAMINPIAPPPPPTESPPPPPVSDDAATTAAPTSSGLRLTFATGQTDLSPESMAAIKQLVAATPSGESATFNVQAYAPGTPDDPSTARRTSLSRAMAVRSALIAEGVASARIFVRALGAQHGNGPADRADVTVEGAGNQAAQK
jgi:outer membrane protein OmpA-like peptidoglycan-associated protein